MVKLPSEQKRVRFYLVTFLILVILGTFSLETAAVGTPAVYAKKIQQQQSPMSNASPAAGDTCAAGSQQGRADFNSNGRLDQSIFDNHGSNYQQCYEQAFQSACLARGNTEAACNDAQDSG
jgi:hypothetical protein